MKKFFLFVVIAFWGIQISAQQFVPVDKGSMVNFTIKNLGLNVNGKFTGLKGNIVFDPAHLTTSHFAVSVNASTVDTDIKARDNHLRKEDYFNVEKFPAINFTSKSITLSSTGQLMVVGMLEMKGVSKEISFPFSATATAEGYLFKGNFKINRRDFKVGGKSLILSDMLTVNVSLLAQKK